MANERALTVSLEEFGLSQYEAQAYVALISRGTTTASELAYYAGIPRTKIYPTLLKLENKKLATISRNKPRRCTAIAPEDAFDGIIHEQIDKVNAMNALVTDLKRASEEGRRSKGSEEKRYAHIGANSVLAQLQSMIEGSKSSIRVMADQWGMGLLAECKKQMLGVLRRNVDVRVIVPPALIGSEAYRAIPAGADIRASEVAQNCFMFDETELLMVSSNDGRGAVFSYTEILGAGQEGIFSSAWKGAVRTRALADMTKAEAQEIYRIIRVVSEAGLAHVLDASMSAKAQRGGLAALLEKHGIRLGSRSLDGIIETMDAVMQITCSGHVSFEAAGRNITVASKLNGGHCLPWVSILDDCLRGQGYRTRTVFQNGSGRSEKVHIKISRE